MFVLFSLALFPSKHCGRHVCVVLRPRLGHDPPQSWNVQVLSSDVNDGAVGTAAAGLGEPGKEPEGTFGQDKGSLEFCERLTSASVWSSGSVWCQWMRVKAHST